MAAAPGRRLCKHPTLRGRAIIDIMPNSRRLLQPVGNPTAYASIPPPLPTGCGRGFPTRPVKNKESPERKEKHKVLCDYMPLPPVEPAEPCRQQGIIFYILTPWRLFTQFFYKVNSPPRPAELTL